MLQTGQGRLRRLRGERALTANLAPRLAIVGLDRALGRRAAFLAGIGDLDQAAARRCVFGLDRPHDRAAARTHDNRIFERHD